MKVGNQIKIRMRRPGVSAPELVRDLFATARCLVLPPRNSRQKSCWRRKKMFILWPMLYFWCGVCQGRKPQLLTRPLHLERAEATVWPA